MRQWIYGIGHAEGNEELYLEKYNTYKKEVMSYFSNRQDDLLIVDWGKGDGWEKICEFLDEPIPNEPFPHANKGDYKVSKLKENKRPSFFRNIFRQNSTLSN